jgi:hypothetical protein
MHDIASEMFYTEFMNYLVYYSYVCLGVILLYYLFFMLKKMIMLRLCTFPYSNSIYAQNVIL